MHHSVADAGVLDQGRPVVQLLLDIGAEHLGAAAEQIDAGADKPRDEIVIAGDPPMKLVLDGGTPGDIATPALLVNSLALLPEARPGLHTMKTLGLPRITA